MCFLGVSFYGPHRYCFYAYINPSYTWLFCKILRVTDRMRWRKVFLRVFSDIGLYNLIYIPMLLFYTGCVRYRLDFNKACDDVRTKFQACYAAGFGYYGIQLTVFYAIIPRYVRAILSTDLSVFWSSLYSWIYHNIGNKGKA